VFELATLWLSCSGLPSQTQSDRQHRAVEPATTAACAQVPAVVPQRWMSVPLVAAYSGPQSLPQTFSQQPVLSSLAPVKDALIIPHDQAYASAVRHHRPMMPSSETFCPPPPTPIVRLCRPSGDLPRMMQGHAALPRGPGLQVFLGRGRRVSIAVPWARSAATSSGMPVTPGRAKLSR
jgi:hypothetical protein